MNLLSETLKKMEIWKHDPKDVAEVQWCAGKKKHCCTWEVFEEAAKGFSYDNGYGCAEVNITLVILFKDGSWMERGEYDGSEWWKHVSLKHPMNDGIVELNPENVKKQLKGDSWYDEDDEDAEDEDDGYDCEE